MKFSDFLNEATQKDIDRMSKLIDTGKDGESVAKSIKDVTKAIDRFVVGLKLSGEKLGKAPYTGKFAAFGNRAIELGATEDQIKKVFDETDISGGVNKETAEKWTPKTKMHRRPTKHNPVPNAVASLGRVNPSTGKSADFDLFDVWGENTTYEVWESDRGRIYLIATSGKSPIYDVGDSGVFKSNSSGRIIFHGVMIDFAVGGSELKSMGKHYGSSLLGYTYK